MLVYNYNICIFILSNNNKMKTIHTIESLTNQIEELKAGRTMKEIQAADKKTYFKVKGLVSKLGEMKATEAGQFITKEHLTANRNVIIAMLNRTNFQGHLDIRSAMMEMMNKVNEGISYKTERGIKGILIELARTTGLNNVENNLRDAHEMDAHDNALNNHYLAAFQRHATSF